jgi:5-methylcytosine-specific restriction endonuclease McrA
MASFTLVHLNDEELLRRLDALVSRERGVTAAMLAHIAEVEARRLYAAHACSSMFDYCVRVLGFSEDAACMRTRVARAGRGFPALFAAIERGRLHLTGAWLIARHLEAGNAAELIDAASRRTKSEIARLLAERFPQNDVPTQVRALPGRRSPTPVQEEREAPALFGAPGQPAEPDERAPTPNTPVAPESQAPDERAPSPDTPAATESQVPDERTSAPNTPSAAQSRVSDERPPGPDTPAAADTSAPRRGSEPTRRHRITPLAPRRYALQTTLQQETHDKLRYAQKLLSHRLPSGDIAQVLDRALDALIVQLEKQRFGATSRPRSRAQDAPERAPRDPRYIPRAVQRAVHARDQGRCTFVDASGRRCGSATFLEYDHVVPLARGGTSSVGNLRLRCRAHNLYAAVQIFGAEYMQEKRRRASG